MNPFTGKDIWVEISDDELTIQAAEKLLSHVIYRKSENDGKFNLSLQFE